MQDCNLESFGSIPDIAVIGFILALFFTSAIITAALTQKSPQWVLLTVGLVGLIVVGICVYLWITVPEGIFDVIFLLIASGAVIAEASLLISRMWHRPRRAIN
ncbi:hypothetical protein KbCgl_04930 [Corynebacterium glutamicum]|nr:hypothetical protein KbCgl_04930 [Corynebacterium glutamicum]